MAYEAIDPGRVQAVADALALARVEDILRLEEEADPQYEAAQRIAGSIGRGNAVVAVMLVALVSYRLAMKGEEWWKCLADHAGTWRVQSLDDVYRSVQDFIASCPGAALAREAKTRRLERAFKEARSLWRELQAKPETIRREPARIAAGLARALGQEPWRKTIVFSVKMGVYAARPPGYRKPVAPGVPLPVDVRVACVSYSSGITSMKPDLVLRKPRPVVEAWGRIEQVSRVPALHIDTILWLAGDRIRGRNTPEARRLVSTLLAPYLGLAAYKIAQELAWRPCGTREHQ